MAEQLMTNSEEMVVRLAKAIALARVQSWEICQRERVMGGRCERVSHFLTCLRRELGTWLGTARQALCQSVLWEDAGVLREGGQYNLQNSRKQGTFGLVSYDQLCGAVRMSRQFEPQPSEQKEIQKELDEISVSLRVLENTLLPDMQQVGRRIGDSVDKIASIYSPE